MNELQLCVIQEYIQLNLFEALHKLQRKFTIPQKVNIAIGIATGMQELYKVGIVHNHLRSSCVMVIF